MDSMRKILAVARDLEMQADAVRFKASVLQEVARSLVDVVSEGVRANDRLDPYTELLDDELTESGQCVGAGCSTCGS